MSGEIYSAGPGVKPVYRKSEAPAQENVRPHRSFADLLSEAERVQDAVELSAAASPAIPGSWLVSGSAWLNGLGFSALRSGNSRKGREAPLRAPEEREG